MVFPGRFSTGCMLCRQRKVKCDETKPSCRRCYIYGKPCPGYTDQFHFRRGLNNSNFINTSPKSATSTGSTTASPPQPVPTQPSDDAGAVPIKKEPESPDDANAAGASSSTQLVPARARKQRWRKQSIMPNPDISYDQVSLCYFVRRFVSPDGVDNFPGHLTFLPEIFNHQGHGVLEIATLSVAQMAAYNQFGGDKFRMQSYKNYGRAIRSLQDSIKTETEATDDRVLATVLLLCMYKDLSGDEIGDPSEHASGLYYLIEKRGLEQLATRRGFELFLLALIRLHVYSFLHDDDTYSDPGGLTQILGTFDPLMRAMFMVARTLQLRHALDKCGRGEPGIDDGVSPTAQSDRAAEMDAPIIKECFEFLDEFSSWDQEASTYWASTFNGREFPAALGEVTSGARYYDPETACTVILVRCSRLILLVSMLEYHDRMQLATGGLYGTTETGAGWAECIPTLEQDIRSTISDMLSLVPYALGDLDASGQPRTMNYDGAGAMIIVQPMRLVTYCRHATQEQVQACQNVLQRLNRTIGIRSAISFTWGDAAAFASKMAGCRDLFDAMAMGSPTDPTASPHTFPAS